MMNYLILFVIVLLMSDNGRIYYYCKVSPRSSHRYRPGICEFPSIYRDKVIRQCQLNHNGQWWCPKDENYDVYNQRTLCPNTTLTYAGSDPGQYCHLPFLYRGKEHRTCIKSSDQERGTMYWWCATTANYDIDRTKRWTRCWEQSDQLPCHFKELGTSNSGINGECRQFNGKWVCHTERNEIRECPHTDSTFAGNSPGERCHFPFLFGQKEYRSCITTRRVTAPSQYGDNDQFESYLWCATTANYNIDRLWTKCVHGDSLSRTVANGAVILPVAVVMAILVAVLCLGTLLHFCCHQHRTEKRHRNLQQQQPAYHISLSDISQHKHHSPVPSAPPSYLEAVTGDYHSVGQ